MKHGRTALTQRRKGRRERGVVLYNKLLCVLCALRVSALKPFALRRVPLAALLLAASVCISGSGHAIERRPGTIKSSDGVELKGEIWVTNGELKIYEGEKIGGRFLKILQHELVSIKFDKKKSLMERPWRFKNAGSDEKEYLPGEYPFIELKSETKLKSGQVIPGHLQTAPIFIRVQNRENPTDWDTSRFILKYQYKGEVGQVEKDIAYVTSITFDDGGEVADAAAATLGSLAGTIKGLGKLEQAGICAHCSRQI